MQQSPGDGGRAIRLGPGSCRFLVQPGKREVVSDLAILCQPPDTVTAGFEKCLGNVVRDRSRPHVEGDRHPAVVEPHHLAVDRHLWCYRPRLLWGPQNFDGEVAEQFRTGPEGEHVGPGTMVLPASQALLHFIGGGNTLAQAVAVLIRDIPQQLRCGRSGSAAMQLGNRAIRHVAGGVVNLQARDGDDEPLVLRPAPQGFLVDRQAQGRQGHPEIVGTFRQPTPLLGGEGPGQTPTRGQDRGFGMLR